MAKQKYRKPGEKQQLREAAQEDQEEEHIRARLEVYHTTRITGVNASRNGAVLWYTARTAPNTGNLGCRRHLGSKANSLNTHVSGRGILFISEVIASF